MITVRDTQKNEIIKINTSGKGCKSERAERTAVALSEKVAFHECGLWKTRTTRGRKAADWMVLPDGSHHRISDNEKIRYWV